MKEMRQREVIRRRRNASRSFAVAVGLLLGATVSAGAQVDTSAARDTVARLPEVVVKADRLGLGGIPLDRFPMPAEVRQYRGLAPAGTPSAADLTQGMVGFSTADEFGSPYQPDVRLRGYQVGPVIGLPQSVSVFVDGVRVNEADASEVNYDLIPLQAVERVEVIRGPGGPFGRNTLAGAINFVTRSGTEGVHGSLAGSGGMFGTGEGEGWVGGADQSFNWLVSGRFNHTDGWRDISESETRQGFAKVGYKNERTNVSLSYTFADDHIEGPGSLPSSWLAGDLPDDLLGTDDPRRLQFTGGIGDFFDPQMHFGNLNLHQTLRPDLGLDVNTFVRRVKFSQTNDNLTEANTLNETDITGIGATAQLTRTWSKGTRLSFGAEYIRNKVDLNIFETPNPSFPDAEGQTEDIETKEDNVGVFAQFWLPTSDRLSWLAALRYDYVKLPVTDLLEPENSGENSFNQVTGSLGLDYQLSEQASIFGSYGRGFRAPVILEVSCADPEDPCPLPFELGADPPLDPVTTNTYQAGLRLRPTSATRVELVGYWADVYNDLFNVIAPPDTRGFFKNIDKTRRQGVELAVNSVVSDFILHGNLSVSQSTFRSTATLSSALLGDDDDDDGGAEEPPEDPEDPGADEGGPVVVTAGDHFAMSPTVTFELGTTWAHGPWSIGLEGNFVGSQYFQGDENNEKRFGTLDSYFVLNGEAEREIGGAKLFVRGYNLLDHEHNTFGLISGNVRGPDEDPQAFLTPGLPIRVTAGIGVDF